MGEEEDVKSLAGFVVFGDFSKVVFFFFFGGG